MPYEFTQHFFLSCIPQFLSDVGARDNISKSSRFLSSGDSGNNFASHTAASMSPAGPAHE
jgi:hypothetical protein